ncbi:hypothetical protein [Thalassobacillus pellis]|uniref:hypothetical protein n=1 Tax=Thalassobacillus pellis TaxID=748008 RepID=UPI00195F69E8|nr:hypothetical protein [Thalassobacillus pellis]MBM7553472.1 hypothetical protein [Thalassobacillus pellis]
MYNHRIRLAVAAFACIILSLFVVFNFHGITAESDELTKKEIMKSMQDTQEKNRQLAEFQKEVHAQLQKSGFEANLSFSINQVFAEEKPWITVWLTERNYNAENVLAVKKIIENQVEIYELGEIDIEVKAERREVTSKEEQEELKLYRELADITDQALGNVESQMAISYIMASETPVITIKILDPTADFVEQKTKIKRMVEEAIWKEKALKVKVKVKKTSKTEKLEMKWHPIFRSVREEIGKKFDVVNGFGTSFHPSPLQIIIKTDLSQAWWSLWGTKREAKEIEDYVLQVIQLKREDLNVEEIPFKIIIRDKNHKAINTHRE